MLVIMYKSQITQIYFQMVTNLSGLKKCLWLKSSLWSHAREDLNGEDTAVTIYEQELQKTNQSEFRNEKIKNKKGD